MFRNPRGSQRGQTLKLYALGVIVGVLSGCTVRPPSWQGTVEWPDEQTAQLVAPSVEAGTALAAAAAIREMIQRNPYPDLFAGCASPEQGLNVAVFSYPKTRLYYVVVHQRFDRCGGPRVRVLDGAYAYAVTPQGEVVAERPLAMGEAPPHVTPMPDGGTEMPTDAGPTLPGPAAEPLVPSAGPLPQTLPTPPGETKTVLEDH